MTYDDFLFYLPAFGSLAFVGISAVLTWVVWRLIRDRKAARAAKSKETDVSRPL
ncbi:MAG TPA: hypothetical protein VL283_00080 [Candidatus Baltobacteraceae bacterium]|jgi:hypothetical protein|nr:hypothetical protein [Candidatus Baltobacteraceae bacterium]